MARYEHCWLPLLANYQANKGSGKDGKLLPIAPPLDVAWVWLVHTLSPTDYAAVSVDGS